MKTISQIKIVYADTHEGHRNVVTIENTLEKCQEIVGGHIETVSFAGLREKGILIVCNEEGLLIGLEPNENLFPYFICGDVFFTTYNDEGDFVSLSDEQVAYIFEHFHWERD